MISRLKEAFSSKARERRAQMLRMRFAPTPQMRILDLGGGGGEHIARVFPGHANVVVADVSPQDLVRAYARGFQTILLNDEEATLPFADGAFDLVFCSSVIEHATGPKEAQVAQTSGPAFKATAQRHQAHFAREIQRVGKSYFVQTPNKYFWIESHSWLPLPVVFLPRPLQIKTVALAGKLLPKRTRPDWNLLTAREMRALFPDAELLREHSLFAVKSLMSFKSGEAAKAAYPSNTSFA